MHDNYNKYTQENTSIFIVTPIHQDILNYNYSKLTKEKLIVQSDLDFEIGNQFSLYKNDKNENTILIFNKQSVNHIEKIDYNTTKTLPHELINDFLNK